MIGEPVSLQSPFPSNVSFVCLIRVNQLNINYGIAFKLSGLGDGPHSSFMNCAGCDPVTMIASIGSKLSLGKGSLRNIARQLRFGIFLEASLCGPFGLNGTTRSLIISNGMRQGLNKEFGMNSLSMGKSSGSG